ncbi:hypothetical protein KAU08_03350, partial [bacterium]|nr:hypothetical protein [bacterium]
GIRPGGKDDPNSDQRRVMSPGEAVKLGSSMLVIGRPIHAAEDPNKAFDDIVKEIEGISEQAGES